MFVKKHEMDTQDSLCSTVFQIETVIRKIPPHLNILTSRTERRCKLPVACPFVGTFSSSLWHWHCWVRLRYLPTDISAGSSNDQWSQGCVQTCRVTAIPNCSMHLWISLKADQAFFGIWNCYIFMTIYSHVSCLFHSGSLIILVTLWQSILNRQSRFVPVQFSLDVWNIRYVQLVNHLHTCHGPPIGIDIPIVSPVSPVLLASS